MIEPDLISTENEFPPIEKMGLFIAASRALCVGVQLAVFTHIADGKRTVTEIARAAEASDRGVRMLLDALVGLQYLTKSGEEYGLTPISSEFLVRDKVNYMGLLLEEEWMWESWSHLLEVVRTGKPVRQADGVQTGIAQKFFRAYIPLLHFVNREPARRAAQVLLNQGVLQPGLRVIDVACGSAVWSIAVAQATGRDTSVTAMDLPPVLEIAREFLKQDGVENQYDFLPGDQREMQFGQNVYDLAIIARYIHDLGEREAQDLFRRIWVALKFGGRIAVTDWMPNHDRTGPMTPLIFALGTLLHKEEGNAHTAADYSRWLHSVGFTGIEVSDLGSDLTLVVAVKQ